MAASQQPLELAQRIAQYSDYIYHEIQTCVRCGLAYIEAENIGQWRCVQRVFVDDGIDGHSNAASITRNRGVYVRADHTTDPHTQEFEPIDDIMIDIHVVSVFRNGVLNPQSIIHPSMLFVDQVGKPRPNTAPSVQGIAGIRRYDFRAHAAAIADRAFRFNYKSRPSDPRALRCRLFVHPSLKNGIVVELASDSSALLAQNEIKMLQKSHRVTFAV